MIHFSVRPNGLKDPVRQPGRRGVRALSDLLAPPHPQVAPDDDDLLGRAAFRLGGRDVGHGPRICRGGNTGAGEVPGAKRDKWREILRPEFAGSAVIGVPWPPGWGYARA